METLPVHIAKLILRFTHNLLTEEEHDELDRWIDQSNENMLVFEKLTEGMEEAVFSANDLIIETDELLDIWMVAGLIAREMEGLISSDEKVVLQNWIAASEQNRAIYQRLTDKANLHKVSLWVRRLLNQEKLPPHLN